MGSQSEMKKPIYLDYNATTPVDERVLDAMLPFLRERFGNAASNHAFGVPAAKAVEHARQQIADLIHADPREIVWTSGATESDNLAIKGVASHYKRVGKHIITAIHEHRAVIDPCKRLEMEGYDVTWLRPGPSGVITARQVEKEMRDDTILVSIMWANNEIGTINQVPQIGEVCRDAGVIFHSDATQYVGKLPFDINEAKIDLLSASAHKLYGPKGVGFLYVRRKGPRVRLDPMFDGGGHERGMRSGTLNVPGIVGLGAAAEICNQHGDAEAAQLGKLRDYLEKSLLASYPTAAVNGDADQRMSHVANITFPGIESSDLIRSLPDVAVSAGSACDSASRESSYVLRGIELTEEQAHGSVRFSIGRFTTKAEIDFAIERVKGYLKSDHKLNETGANLTEITKNQ
jgi:cysteine desulfurase